MNAITVACTNIVKNFAKPGSEAMGLRGISFTAYQNEMILLMGPSGSGKTTLLSIIGGLLTQDSGECVVLDKHINSLPEEEKTRFRGNNIGFMFQYFNLVPTLTAIENVAVSLLIKGVEKADAYERASELLIKLGLEHQRHQNVRSLSGGEQQRVAIARACINKPPLVLCDEPTSFLDRERGKSIMELLQSIKFENHCTLIVVTHDPRIIGFADRILEIEDGLIKKN